MTGNLIARWLITPAHPPIPQRSCANCAAMRPFVSSGLVRLNANGKTLDAWLIYRCAACDRTWNRPLLERVSIRSIDRAAYEALQRSCPDYVRACEFDLSGLSKFSQKIELSSEIRVLKHARPAQALTAEVTLLEIIAERPLGMRLDRLLAQELDLSRSQLDRLREAGDIRLIDAGPSAFRKPVTGGVTAAIAFSRLQAPLPDLIRRRLFA